MTDDPGLAPAGYFLEDLVLGMEAALERMIAESDLVAFAEVSGDTNPVHLDEAYAATTPFRTRIAHGMLTASLISAVLGTRLPGPGAVYLSQSLRFRAPVKIGDQVRTIARVTEIDTRRRRVSLACSCSVGDAVVLEGEAIVMVPSRGREGA
jgi:3-hydroxybutyryl-CoA dehydratase